MGCDIHGYVEVKKYGSWESAINISSLVHRNYGMFGLLFGVRNSAKFIPVAPDRGLPSDISEETEHDAKEWDADGHSHSWISYSEIAAINWNEQGTELADRIFGYLPGESTPSFSFAWSTGLTDEDYDALNRGESIERPYMEYGAVRFSRATMNTSEARASDWQCLFDLMKTLDEYHRKAYQRDTVESKALPATQNTIEDNCMVRLVVWFDN